MTGQTPRYSDLIRSYCEKNKIEIPDGFKRHPASRYVIIYLSEPLRLVARTWRTHDDVIYYLNNLAEDTPKKILDFKDGVEMIYMKGTRMQRGQPFDVR